MNYHMLVTDLVEKIKAKLFSADEFNKSLFFMSLGEFLLELEQNGRPARKIIPEVLPILQQAFPEVKGFTIRRLRLLRDWAVAGKEITKQETPPGSSVKPAGCWEQWEKEYVSKKILRREELVILREWLH